ncbi:hypothetical protein M1563_02470 [Patescibacteria group bacterium]|nr:hypothetical protein [Patescibacteria group bacterium]
MLCKLKLNIILYKIPSLITRNKFLIVVFLILFLSYSVNFFNSADNQLANNFEVGSQNLVEDAIRCQIIYHHSIFNNLLVSADTTCDTLKSTPYFSQSGIQGYLLAVFAPKKLFLLPLYYFLCRFIFAALLSIILSLYVFVISKEFSKKIAIFVMLLLAFSNWLIYFAKNLYWISFTMFLPYIFAWSCYLYFKKKSRLFLFYLIIGFLITIRSLAGYEYLSNIILSCFTPILYYEIIQKTSIKSLIKKFLLICIVGFFAFSIAFAIQLYQVSTYLGSFPAALSKIGDKASERTFNNTYVNQGFFEQIIITSPPVYNLLNSLNLVNQYNNTASEQTFFITWSIIRYVFSPTFSLSILPTTVNLALFSMFPISLLTFLILSTWRKSKLMMKNKQLFALYWCTLYSLIASFSWFILAPGHSINHPHMNGIIFYLPFLLVAYIVLSIQLARLLPNLPRILHKSFSSPPS